MAFTTGSATDYHDLLNKLRLWLTGTAGWTQMLWTAPGSMTANAVLAVRAPGGGAGRRPVCWFSSFSSAVAPYYTWQIRVAGEYDAVAPITGQPEVSPPTYLSLMNTAITYWFYANDRRVIIVAKIGTAYVSAYAGFFLPFALPNEWERPFYVSANSPTVSMPPSSSLVENSFIADPGYLTSYFITRDHIWREVGNRVTGAGSDGGGYAATTGRACLWPKKVSPGSGYVAGSGGSVNLNMFTNLRPNNIGEMPMFQCHIHDQEANSLFGAVYGALDGVFAIPGSGRVTEQQITQGAQNFRVFQNVTRSSLNHFMAIMEV